jgi:hypothetical protein
MYSVIFGFPVACNLIALMNSPTKQSLITQCLLGIHRNGSGSIDAEELMTMLCTTGSQLTLEVRVCQNIMAMIAKAHDIVCV